MEACSTTPKKWANAPGRLCEMISAAVAAWHLTMPPPPPGRSRLAYIVPGAPSRLIGARPFSGAGAGSSGEQRESGRRRQRGHVTRPPREEAVSSRGTRGRGGQAGPPRAPGSRAGARSGNGRPARRGAAQRLPAGRPRSCLDFVTLSELSAPAGGAAPPVGLSASPPPPAEARSARHLPGASPAQLTNGAANGDAASGETRQNGPAGRPRGGGAQSVHRAQLRL